ncbi:MAG TPA: hypothetical protein DGO89_16355 [Microcoleaceae bacterium UBA9251]|nr:hypothetical protein [Microcoleaceae cyanobacterium UBA9251]
MFPYLNLRPKYLAALRTTNLAPADQRVWPYTPQSIMGYPTDDGAKLKVPRPKSAKQEPKADQRLNKTSPQPC